MVEMNKKMSFVFVMGIIVGLITLDIILTKIDPVANSTIFEKNDFEKVRDIYPYKSYKKIFYGNSAVMEGYLEEKSTSDFIDISISYGTIKDLYEMLEQKKLLVDDEIVFGINYLNFLDNFETNPSYSWHRKWYEPYLYFQRDRIYQVITKGIDRKLLGNSFIETRYKSKPIYIPEPILKDLDLDKKLAIHKRELWTKEIEEYKINLDYLQKTIDFCEKEKIEFRCVFLPWNDRVEKPKNVRKVEKKAKEILDRNNIEYTGFNSTYPREMFADVGHLTYGYGAVEFTKEIDKWLKKK